MKRLFSSMMVMVAIFLLTQPVFAGKTIDVLLMNEFKNKVTGIQIYFEPLPDSKLEDRWYWRERIGNTVDLTDFSGIVAGTYNVKMTAFGDGQELFVSEKQITIIAGQITETEAPVFKMVTEIGYHFEIKDVPEDYHFVKVMTAEKNPALLYEGRAYTDSEQTLHFYAEIPINIRAVKVVVKIESELFISRTCHINPLNAESVILSENDFSEIGMPDGTGGISFVGIPSFVGPDGMPIDGIIIGNLEIPVPQNISPGIRDTIFASFSFDATASDEDISFQKLTIALEHTGNPHYLENCQLWANGEQIGEGTYIHSDFVSGKNITFTLDEELIVLKGTIKQINLRCDVGLYDGCESYRWSIKDNQTGIGMESWDTISVPTTGNGQIFILGENLP